MNPYEELFNECNLLCSMEKIDLNCLNNMKVILTKIRYGKNNIECPLYDIIYYEKMRNELFNLKFEIQNIHTNHRSNNNSSKDRIVFLYGQIPNRIDKIVNSVIPEPNLHKMYEYK